MRRASSMESLMQITVSELAEALGAARTFVRLHSENQTRDSLTLFPEANGKQAVTSEHAKNEDSS